MSTIVIDPATSAFLEMVRASGGKPFNELSVEEIRGMITASSQQLAPPREELHDVRDQRIPVDGGEITLRICTPRALSPGETLPMLLYFHGGGFVAGDIDTHDAIARYLSKHADAIAVSVDYRRSPEYRYPTQINDAYAALAWMAEHASELRGDAGRIAVAGDSAGGTLSVVMTQLAAERGGPRIAFQALVYPWLDLRPGTSSASRLQFGGGEYFLANSDLEYMLTLYLSEGASSSDARVSPLLYDDLAGMPPAVIMTAGCDPVCDDGKTYGERLAAAGVPVEYRCFETTIHACVSFAGIIPAGLEALSFLASRIRAALH
jgi:acetyl esterase